MRKNILVEGYRFVIAISIALFHFFKIWSNNNNWRLGVEFFFILSGFLLMQHCYSRKNETVWQLTWGKIKSFYPYYLIMFALGIIAEVVIKESNILICSYLHLHQLLFLTDWFKGKCDYLAGTGQLWFITTQLWIIPIIGYLTKKHKELYKAVIAPAFVIIGYTLIIRCSGNLNANMYITVLEKEIWIPFCLLSYLVIHINQGVIFVTKY